MRTRLVCLALTLSSIVGGAAATNTSCMPTMTLAAGSPTEQQTRAQLERLFSQLPLDMWMITRSVRIEDRSIPHSHPILTLSARHLDNDALLVATLIHEQMHWWLDRHSTGTQRAKDDLRQVYRSLPVGFPEGAGDEDSSYEHLLIIWLEMKGVKTLLGVRAARAVLDFWKTDHYTALYTLVDKDMDKIGAIVQRRKLVFLPARQPGCAG
jgi:hypothetical protein